jgi:hypothetical protein
MKTMKARLGLIIATVLLAACGDNPTSPAGAGLPSEPLIGRASTGTGGLIPRRRVSDATTPVTVTVTSNSSSATQTGVPPNTTVTFDVVVNSYLVAATQGSNVVTAFVTVPLVGAITTTDLVLDTNGNRVTVTLVGVPFPTPTPPPLCTITAAQVGDGVDLQGRVESGDQTAFRLSVGADRASGPVGVNAGTATYVCVGMTGGNCAATLGPATLVHVRGTFTGCNGSSPLVTASVVRVQQP